jgi:hypothetical protein
MPATRTISISPSPSEAAGEAFRPGSRNFIRMVVG